MLKIEHVHKFSALKTLVDQNDAGAIVAKHFYFAPVLAKEHEQIAVNELCAHLLTYKRRQPVKACAQIDHGLEHEHADVGFELQTHSASSFAIKSTADFESRPSIRYP